MNWAGSFCRDLGTLVKRNKNQLCGDMTTEPAQLAWIPVIPGGNFPSNHACLAARRTNQSRNRTAGNTPAPAHCFQPLYKNGGSRLTLFMYYRDKSHLGSQPGSCDQALTVSCIVTQFARESFGICRFCGSCMREYDLILRWPTGDMLQIKKLLQIK